VTREEAIRVFEQQRHVANLRDADELWLSLKAKESDLYERLTNNIGTIKPKKRRRLEQDLHCTRVLLALMRANFPVVRTILENQ